MESKLQINDEKINNEIRFLLDSPLSLQKAINSVMIKACCAEGMVADDLAVMYLEWLRRLLSRIEEYNIRNTCNEINEVISNNNIENDSKLERIKYAVGRINMYYEDA